MADLRNLNQVNDLTVASGDPDPRGWEVASTDGRAIGTVKDLVVDTDAMEARYLDIEVYRGLSTEKRHLLVPTETVAIGARERDERRISLPLTPERAIAAAHPAGAVLSQPTPTQGEWPRATRDMCNVRVKRGDHNG